MEFFILLLQIKENWELLIKIFVKVKKSCILTDLYVMKIIYITFFGHSESLYLFCHGGGGREGGWGGGGGGGGVVQPPPPPKKKAKKKL